MIASIAITTRPIATRPIRPQAPPSQFFSQEGEPFAADRQGRDHESQGQQHDVDGAEDQPEGHADEGRKQQRN